MPFQREQAGPVPSDGVRSRVQFGSLKSILLEVTRAERLIRADIAAFASRAALRASAATHAGTAFTGAGTAFKGAMAVGGKRAATPTLLTSDELQRMQRRGSAGGSVLEGELGPLSASPRLSRKHSVTSCCSLTGELRTSSICEDIEEDGSDENEEENVGSNESESTEEDEEGSGAGTSGGLEGCFLSSSKGSVIIKRPRLRQTEKCRAEKQSSSLAPAARTARGMGGSFLTQKQASICLLLLCHCFQP